MRRPWYVITGPPHAGNSTTLERLGALGYTVVPEAAREIIDRGLAEGRTLGEIRGDERAFQDAVLALKVEREAALPADSPAFLDRGIPDTLAYYELHGLPVPPSMVGLARSCRYRRVFLLEGLGYSRDYARTEDEPQAREIARLLGKWYCGLGFDLVPVPRLPVEERLRIILSNL